MNVILYNFLVLFFRSIESRYSKLCALCHNPQQCKEDDQFSGFRGSLRCLTENGGDIAWTKLDTVSHNKHYNSLGKIFN